MSNIAIVTGAGSGVGRAVVLSLAAEGWGVALVGRRPAPLEETVRAAGGGRGRLLAIACDVADEPAVNAMAGRVARELGAPRVLVNAAGINIPRRGIAELSTDDFRRLIDVNLTGAFLCVHAVLPLMRDGGGGGTIVNIVSDAGLQASAKAGPAYVASKFGLRGLTQSINAEQREHGIRACAIHPGDIDTPLLERRPVPPSPEARGRMLQPEDIARCVMLVINLPPRAIVEELLIRPR